MVASFREFKKKQVQLPKKFLPAIKALLARRSILCAGAMFPVDGGLPGYHPPQFSEDAAWLPAWLQPHQVPFSGEQIKDSQNICPVMSKDMPCLQDKFSSGPEELFPKGDARYSGFCLYLSGDGDSPIESTPSSGRALHFHLHLSSAGISQLPSTELPDIPQTGRPESNKVASVQPILEASVEQEKCHQCKTDLMQPACSPKISQKSLSPYLTKDNRNRKKLQDKFNSGSLQISNIYDAVELSIAASEALVISELMKSDPSSEAWPATSTLEIALWVKQARNQCHGDMEDGLTCPTHGFDETDQLSDLDENIMANAFEDVGLSVTQVSVAPDDLCGCGIAPPNYPTNSCSPDIKHGDNSYCSSYVQNTEVSKSHCECDGGVQDRERRSQDVDCISSPKKVQDGSATELRLKALQQEYPQVQQTKPYGDVPSISGPSNIENCLNAELRQPVLTTTEVLATTDLSSKEDVTILKGVNYDADVMPFYSQESMVSSLCIADSWKPVDIGNVMTNVATERFRSRWFGGWTAKGVEAAICEGPNNIKSIPRLFIRETSSLSESMDVPTDENSVQKPEAGPEAVAFSSTPLVAIPPSTNEGMFLSQDAVGSSNFSMADPLCSVVPCSITSENDHAIQASGKKDLEQGEIQQSLNPTMEHVVLETIPLMPFFHGKEYVASKMSGEALGTTIHRHLASLKLYSTVGPDRYTGSGGEHVNHNESIPLAGSTERHSQIPLLEGNVNCFSCMKQGEEPGVTNMLGCTSYRDPQKTTVGAPILEPTGQNSSKMPKDVVEVQVPQFEERHLPLILNYGAHCRLTACNIIISDTEEESPKRASMQHKRKKRSDDSRTDVSCIDKTKSTHFGPLPSSLRSRACERSPANKRVHFKEVDVEDCSGNTLQKLLAGNRTRSQTKTGRRLKDSSPGSNFGTGKENYICLKRCSIKYRKEMLLRGLEFLLTGFSRKREKELETLIRKHGGIVLSDVPSTSLNPRGNRQSRHKHQLLPVVLSQKKMKTTKFLYGCAIDTLLLKANWLTDSVQSGSLLSPNKYLILPNQASNRKSIRIGHQVHSNNLPLIFERVGIMLFGKPAFCSKLAKVVKHGGGQVFKTLHLLVQSLNSGRNSVGAIVFEDVHQASRHLRHCASEQKLQLMPASWIINSLHTGRLLSFKNNDSSAPLQKMLEFLPAMDFSEEI